MRSQGASLHSLLPSNNNNNITFGRRSLTCMHALSQDTGLLLPSIPSYICTIAITETVTSEHHASIHPPKHRQSPRKTLPLGPLQLLHRGRKQPRGIHNRRKAPISPSTLASNRILALWAHTSLRNRQLILLQRNPHRLGRRHRSEFPEFHDHSGSEFESEDL